MGIHTNSHHRLDKLEAEQQKIVVRIGICKTDYNHHCPDPHNRPAKPEELEKALEKSK